MDNHFTPQIERIRQDVRCGNKMGTSSALRLLDIVEQIGREIANLRRRLEKETGT
jgi:hypothetical protein